MSADEADNFGTLLDNDDSETNRVITGTGFTFTLRMVLVHDQSVAASGRHLWPSGGWRPSWGRFGSVATPGVVARSPLVSELRTI